jgi:ribonucrease Y
MSVITLMTLLFLLLGGIAAVVIGGMVLEQRFQQRLKEALKQQQDRLKDDQQTLHKAQQRLAAEQQALEKERALQKEALLRDWEAELVKERAERLHTHAQWLEKEKAVRSAEVLARSIQSQAASHTRERTRLEIPLPEDKKLRGRLIGKSGRNIQSFQQVTGTDMQIQDHSVVLSCFDPLKLELARRTLHELMTTVMVSPETIETIHTEAEKNLAQELPTLAAKAARAAGLKEPLAPALLQAMGTLYYRTSAGQNLLLHAQEVSQLAGIMAQEIGADEQTARRGGFLHDVGKALPDTPDSGTHAMRGVALAKTAGESEAILHTMAAHHREVEPMSAEAFLVQAADALSAARPGVRSEKEDWQGSRVSQLESLIQPLPGVERVVVLQAGHEIRVMVDPDEMSDEASQILGHEIAQKVRAAAPDLRVKISVIRAWKGSHYV